MRVSNSARIAVLGLLPALVVGKSVAAVNIYAGPAYVGGIGGAGGVTSQGSQLNPGLSVVSGMSIGRGTQAYPTAGTPSDDNTASFLITPSGATLLTSIGTRPSGNPNSATVYAISASGMMAGQISNSTFTQLGATRWTNPSSPTALSPLTVSTNAAGSFTGNAYTINGAGIVAGSSTFFGNATTGAAGGSSNLGSRPVFWAANSTTPTALGIYNLGSNFGTNFSASGSVQSMNEAGTMVGSLQRYATSIDGSGADLGPRATLWAAGGGAATELPFLGNTDPGGITGSFARVINSNGVVGGYSQKYAADGTFLGQRPVRWLNPSTVSELDVSGTTAAGSTTGDVFGVNAAGDAVGRLNRYTGANVSLGTLPALWKEGGTALTPLAQLGTSASGTSTGAANSINDFGFSVGVISDYANGGDAFGTTGGVSVAALWAPDGSVTNLSTLIPTVASGSATPGWVLLSQAYAISNDGWISGVGVFNPGGGLATYNRDFLIQNTSVPEPASLAVVSMSLLAMRRRRD